MYATGGQIFTSEEVELPRDPVIAYLEGIDSRLGARYLEYLMQERKEESTHNGDRLAELYLKMTKDAKRKRDEGASCRFARLGSFRHRGRILFLADGVSLTHYRDEEASVRQILGIYRQVATLPSRQIVRTSTGRRFASLPSLSL